MAPDKAKNEKFNMRQTYSISGQDLNFDGFVLEIDHGAQIPVTTRGFELPTSYKQCSYLTH